MTHIKRILITADPQEVRVAIVEGGKLSEAYIERRGRRSIVGNIYKGRVDAVLPGMEAAFVDVGLDKNGFLYVDEIVAPELDDRERRKKRIQELIKPGQDLLVQVVKDPMGTKGARLTMEVSLAGRFMVLVPEGDGFGVSRKLPEDERDRLRELLRKLRQGRDGGLIVRTAAASVDLDELERDLRLLEKLWDTTQGNAQRAEAPALVYAEPDLSLQMIRDDFRVDVAEVVVDDERQFHRIASYVRRTSPELAERVKLYKGKRSLFTRYEIEQGIRSTLRRRVELPSGGYLMFDYAEAFTIIDVNTGRFTGTKRLEDTIIKNNLEAAVEVVRQLRLRDVGGIIVVDFIDMASQKNRDAVLAALQKELEKDRTKVYLVEISPLGLVELTRKNIAEGVRELMTETCPHCEGTGRQLSDESISIDNLRTLRSHSRESKAEAFQVAVHDEIAAAMIGPGGTRLREFELETGRFFDLEGRTDVDRDFIEVRAEGARAEIEAGATPLTEGEEIELLLDEPHMYVETDAVGHLESGYVVAVTGAGPYVGQKHRVRIDRATRFTAFATLLDAEPAQPAPVDPADRESDLLEPERRVGERVDVEGRVRRQKRRAAGEKRREQRKTRAPGTAPVDAAEETLAVVDEVLDSDGNGHLDGDADATNGASPAKRRRRRRGGRGRRRTTVGAGVGSGPETGDEGGRERAPARAPEPVAAPTSTDEGAESPSAKRRRRRRRATGTTPRSQAAARAPEAAPPSPPSAPRPPAAPRPAPPRGSEQPDTSAKRSGLLGRLLGRRPQ